MESPLHNIFSFQQTNKSFKLFLGLGLHIKTDTSILLGSEDEVNSLRSPKGSLLLK